MVANPDDRLNGSYQDRLAYFKNVDSEKEDMIAELVENLEKAQIDCRQTSRKLKNAENRLAQNSVEGPNPLTNDRGFVVVLIDADADDYIFRDRFLDNSESGGKNAADELNDRIKDYLGSINIDPTTTNIVVKAYTDLKSLQVTCLKKQKMKTSSSMYLFARSFNQRQALFDFVDIGPGKEGADNKIRENLSFFASIPQCKHIIFGACHDSGYAPFLGKFAADSMIRDRITLLQGSSNGIHPRIANLGFGKPLKLDTVFAPNKMSSVASSPSTFHTVVNPMLNREDSPSDTSLPSTSSSAKFVNPRSMAERLGPVISNEKKVRIDKMLSIDVTSPYINVLRESRLCFWYYLRGYCDGSCNKNHVAQPLDAREFDYLWFVARWGLCFKLKKGKVCDDRLCVHGHEEGCPIGTGRP